VTNDTRNGLQTVYCCHAAQGFFWPKAPGSVMKVIRCLFQAFRSGSPFKPITRVRIPLGTPRKYTDESSDTWTFASPSEGKSVLLPNQTPLSDSIQLRCRRCHRWLVRREGSDVAFHVRFLRVTPPEGQAWGMCPHCKLEQPLPLTLLV